MAEKHGWMSPTRESKSGSHLGFTHMFTHRVQSLSILLCVPSDYSVHAQNRASPDWLLRGLQATIFTQLQEWLISNYQDSLTSYQFFCSAVLMPDKLLISFLFQGVALGHVCQWQNHCLEARGPCQSQGWPPKRSSLISNIMQNKRHWWGGWGRRGFEEITDLQFWSDLFPWHPLFLRV